MRGKGRHTWILGVLGVLGGCNSFDEPAEEKGPRLVIPVDERPAVQSSIAPLPVSGGTLLASSDGTAAIVSDPEHDMVSIVDLRSFSLRQTIALEPGDQPGRAVEDLSGRVHIALRGSGSVVTVDVATGGVLQRRAVCKAPRGLAFDAVSSMLHVACAEGTLASLAADGGDVLRAISLPPDLRDVIVQGTELWVTRFKSAEILRIDAQGAAIATVSLQDRAGTLTQPVDTEDGFGSFTSKPVTLQPEVAWRTVAMSGGGAVIVHQDAVKEEIELTEPSVSGSSYGGGSGGFDCAGIVQNGVAVLGPDGSVVSRRGFVGAPLPVDVAVSPDGQMTAVAHAGLPDPGAPRPFVQSFDDHFGEAPSSSPEFFGGGVSILRQDGGRETCSFPSQMPITEPVVAVAFTKDGHVLAQTRQPPQLFVSGAFPEDAPNVIPLPGDSRLDTGHEIFHRDSGGGIACASCHPEGAEDGHVWRFAGVGERRTQALHVGLGKTAPFHWNGDLDDVGSLMTEVFVGRMGGVRQSAERLDVLTSWLFGIDRPAPIRDAGEEAVVRGDTLFHSAATGCSNCHAGDALTNNRSVSVGTTPSDVPLQVPSLVAIGYRAPFMHNGCAATLAGRFDPACGGSEHGSTAQLTETELGDLIAYLESL